MTALHDAEQAIVGLRPVQDSDSEGLIALIGGIWSTYDNVVLDVDREEPWLRAPASSYAELGGRMWVVGEAPSACVAARAVKGDAAAFELKSLYVDASHRRQGLGQRLVRLVEAYVSERGARRIVLWSDTKFLEAHQFYAALGYARTGGYRELGDLSGTAEYEFELRLV